VRALPHVPWRDLTGRAPREFSTAASPPIAGAGFDDAFIYDELKIAPAGRRISEWAQLLRDDSLAIFSAWKQQAKKDPY